MQPSCPLLINDIIDCPTDNDNNDDGDDDEGAVKNSISDIGPLCAPWTRSMTTPTRASYRTIDISLRADATKLAVVLVATERM